MSHALRGKGETDMKRLMTAVCIMGLMGTAAAAQTGSTPMGKMDKDKMSKDKMATAKPHSALHVTSVKMIAATCS